MTVPSPTSTYLNDVYLGTGIVSEMGDILAEREIHDPLVVTDEYLRTNGFVDALDLEDPVVFDAVRTNPDVAMVQAGTDVYEKHGCDGLVALGGGSPIDAAKGIAITHTHEESPDAFAVQTDRILEHPLPPIVAVPTTAGSGSEVGRATLIVTTEGEKVAIIDPAVIPAAAVCDPELTLSLPPRLTAATGMDAIPHCIETFCSPRENPTADAVALDGFARAYRHLPSAVEGGTDLDARREMMIAALHGGLAFQKGLGAVHALSHPLGGLAHLNLHHGTLNAIFLPHVLRYNAPVIPERLALLAETIGIEDPETLPAVFEQQIEALPLPSRLSALGVTNEEIETVIEGALRDHCAETNPRSLDEASVRSLYEAAL